MLDKYLNPENLDPKHIETAYELLKEYCDKNGLDVVKFVSDPANIRPAAEHINKELPRVYRWVLTTDKLENIITSNIDFIKQKAQEFSTPASKLKKS